ncbi:hypothetical protein TCSYLVIO_009213 [Trypanosoma cruzi]|nr:hypothetical protein TCSYLVIO_009213 [Trypanosoma cruzi]
MTSYAELLAACTEFQENFASLNGKYNVAVQEVQNAKEANERLSKQVEAMRSSEDKLQHTIRELKKELHEAHAYKDRYLAANVSVEHLKGRLENARRAVADKMLEHEQQVEQLQGQIRDLLQRVSVCADTQTTQKLKKQVVELEERCAEQSGHLLEEKERGSQQLLASHTALREQQARNLELEQRCRTLEAEITQMRSVVRRSADLQNEAAVAREKSASDARRAVMQAESLAAELRETRARLNAVVAQHAEEMEAAKSAADDEKSQLLERVSQLSAAVDDAVASRNAEQERYAVLQRSLHERVEAVRTETRLEVTVLQKSLSDARAEGQQLAWRVEQTKMELEESRRAVQQREAKLESCATELRQLQTRLDAVTQREAWLSAERDHQLAQLAAAREQAQRLAASQRAHEESNLAGERLRIQLQFLEEELQGARRLAEASDSHVRDIEEAADRRLRALRSELKSVKKNARAERAKADAVRRRLVQALLEREANVLPQICLQTQRPHETVATAPEQQRPAVGLDVLTLLRGQTEQAAALHHRLVELSR